ncbi:MAG: glycosyltransferase family 2 protein [Peptoniphilaceae bacterium]|nr:glycosyltransferase family 2 protein [Peptoniphilaceae bacterium]
MSKELPRLSIVIPCYNEEEVLPVTVPLFRAQLQKMVQNGSIAADSRILFVNDGSKDATWPLIEDLAARYVDVEGLSLSRNRGHQNALLAGLMEARSAFDITISIDCDGQDDIAVMQDMVDAYHNGNDIVYGVRKDRSSDTWFKRTTAQGYYKFLHAMGAEVVYNHADYRLVSARVLNAFSDFHEVNIYLRGMFPLVGFSSTSVSYDRHERLAGESHYPLKKMLALAFNGITSLSIKPIRIITSLGLFISALSFLLIVWVFISYFTGNSVPGWSSSVLATALLGGIQLLSLGVIGEYVGKIYLETKQRPRFIISERTWEDANV